MTYQPGTFFSISHKSVDSGRFKKLSANAKVAYFVFKRAYNGHNNGNILMSSRMMAERLNCSHPTASRAIIELTQARIVEVTCRDEYGPEPKARTYRLLEHKCDVSGMRAGKASTIAAKKEAAE
jgi:hypothetical protein